MNNNTVQGGGVNSILTINTATVEDGGKYRCNATNADRISSVSDEAELISKFYVLYNLAEIFIITL